MSSDRIPADSTACLPRLAVTRTANGIVNTVDSAIESLTPKNPMIAVLTGRSISYRN
ncbi:hypothetical protein [Nocardia fluminea]|uniref:hypothetical protein n=1 Tax=Nocardia fluminea TaxID=134984 RepID=UPI003662D9C1